jgi:hypothetical protein
VKRDARKEYVSLDKKSRLNANSAAANNGTYGNERRARDRLTRD